MSSLFASRAIRGRAFVIALLAACCAVPASGNPHGAHDQPAPLPARLGPMPDVMGQVEIREIETTQAGALFNTRTDDAPLKEITVTGLDLIFDPRLADGLYQRLNAREDLLSLSLIADRVFIRAPLKLPGTRLNIHARELIFEDLTPEQPALIDTTPIAVRERVGRARGFNRDADKDGEDGIHGEPGGDIQLVVGQLFAPGEGKRFILNGTDGQHPGKGEHGRAGHGVNYIESYQGHKKTNWSNVIYIDRTGLLNVENKLRDGVNWFSKPFAGGNEVIEKAKDWGSTIEPKDGTRGLAGGQPGNGGDGGNLSSNLPADALTALIEQHPGEPGARSPAYYGGRAGWPSTWVKLAENGIKTWATEQSRRPLRDGSDSKAKTGKPGKPGEFQQIDQTFAQPEVLAMRLELIRQAYLANHIDLATELVSEYLRMLADYQLGWLRDDPRFAASHAEIARLGRQLNAGLDYFGNPPGWTPLLSLEVLQRTYGEQIDESLRLLALVHWLQANWQDDDQRRHTLAGLMQGKQAEIEQAGRLYRQAQRLLPRLQAELATIRSDADDYLAQLAIAEQNLLARHQDQELVRASISALRSTAETWAFLRMGKGGSGKMAGALFGLALADNLIHAGQASAGTASESLDALLQQDAISAAQQRFAELQIAGVEDADAYVAQLDTLSEALAPATRQQIDAQIQTRIDSDTQARFEQLKQQDPEFEAAYQDMVDLITRKEVFAGKVGEAFQLLDEAMAWLAEASRSLDALRDESITLASDPRLRAALAEVDRRARERLIRYKYYLTKAYEYRMLQSCPIDYRDNQLFDQLAGYLDAKRDVDGLPRQDVDTLFQAMRQLYREDISQLQDLMLREYSEARPDRIRTARRVVLLPKELERLNRHGEVQIDLGPRVTLTTDRDVRIAAIEVDRRYTQLIADEDSPLALASNLEVGFAPSDWTVLHWQDRQILFRYGVNQALSLVRWGFSWYPGGEIQSFGVDEEQLGGIDSIADIRRKRLRPGANTALHIRRELSPVDAPVSIERLAFVVTLDKHKIR